MPLAVAALLNIGLLGGIVATYIQNMRLIRSYFTIGLVVVASLFVVQNIVIVIFWSTLYMAGPSIKNIIDADSLLVRHQCSTICSVGSAVMDNKKIVMPMKNCVFSFSRVLEFDIIE